MKQILLIALTLFTFNSFGQNSTDPGEYMSYFSGEYLRIQEDMWDYTRTISHGKSARKVEKKRFELIKSTQSALSTAKKAKGFKGSTRYRDSVVSYFRIIDIVLREDYGKILNMEEISEQSYDLMEAYMMAKELASDKLTAAGDMISEEHKLFAEENNVTIIETESELSKKMDIANKVYDHYNSVYLVFFKSYKQELYLLDAIGSNDVSAIEQNRNALLDAVEEGLINLDTISKYKGDEVMIKATKELLNFYKEEAEKDVDIVLNYIDKTESFQKIKEAFDQIKEKNRTQEDVDQYNNGVNEMNKAVNEYNEMNQIANEKREELINNWNRSSEKFTSTHVPKRK